MLVGAAVVTVLGLCTLLTGVALVNALVIGPFVAATLATPLMVGLVGVYAITWAAALGSGGEHWSGDHWLRILLVAGGSIVAVVAAEIRSRYVRDLVRTLQIADVAQRALLRPVPERVGNVRIEVRYVSASEGALIGGDLYDAEVTPWGLRVFVGDVRGKGLDAVGPAATLLAAFRESAADCADLTEVAKRLDERLVNYLGDRFDFVTGVLATIRRYEVELVNCGHPDPILVKRTSVGWLESPVRTRPFGFHPQPVPVRHDLTPGDRLVLYTDGLPEARDRQRHFFPVLDAASATMHSRSLSTSVDALCERLRRHVSGRLHDDVVVLALETERYRQR
jgi:serine phosphatase RsbU (regulator of sigma subunit)